MELKLGVCPHDTETEEGKKRWRRIAQELSQRLGVPVLFEPFKDFDEEKDKLQKETFHIYYANLFVAEELHQKGYKVVGIYTKEKDRGVLIKRKGEELKEPITVATVRVPIVVFPIINAGLDPERIDLLLCKSFTDALLALKEGKANLSLIHDETYKNLPKEDWFEEYAVSDIPQVHFFMVHPELESEAVEALLSLPYVRNVGQYEFEYALNFNRLARAFIDTMHANYVQKVLENSPHIGVLIYREKILHANEYAQKLLGYSLEELKNMSTADLMWDESIKPTIRAYVERRLKGERFVFFHPSLRMRKKDGASLWVIAYADTIVYEGDYAGLALFIDITKEKRWERLKNLLHKVNQSAFGVSTEEELFQKVCKVLVDEVGLRMVWVGMPDESGWFKVLSSYGHVEGYLDNIRIYHSPELPEGRGPVGMAYHTGEVQIIDDTRTNPRFIPWRERALPRGYLSVAGVPLKKEGKGYAVLALYADEPYYFDEETREVLEQLSKDLSLVLDFLEETRKSVLISTALDGSDAWVLITDEEGNILYVNEGLCRISGYTREELIGKNPRIFKSGYQSPDFYKRLWETIKAGKEFHSTFINRKKSGETFYLDQRIIPVELPGGVKRFVSVGKDITREHSMSEEIERLRLYDPLTSLYNYNGFFGEVSRQLERFPMGVLVLIDIHGTSYINSLYGLETGDRILRYVGNSLREVFGESAVVGRLGGDEFGMFIGVEEEEPYKYVAIVDSMLQNTFATPYPIDDKNSLSVKYNAGVAIYPDDGETFYSLYSACSFALREAKSFGINTTAVYNKDKLEKAQRFFHAERLVREAFEENLFVFHYQPYYDLRSMEIKGLEALVRIRTQEGKIVPPSEFIDFLEGGPYEYLRRFEEWALKHLSEKAQEWGVCIGVNISAKTFVKGDALRALEKVAESMKRGKLVVEITERTAVENMEIFTKHAKRIRSIDSKFSIAIDDFGTGYSSLSYLVDLPINIVKLDMSFVQVIDIDPKMERLVRHIISMLKSLGYITLAEGVETSTQLELLKDMGCDYAQGYYLCKPLPEEEIVKLIG